LAEFDLLTFDLDNGVTAQVNLSGEQLLYAYSQRHARP